MEYKPTEPTLQSSLTLYKEKPPEEELLLQLRALASLNTIFCANSNLYFTGQRLTRIAEADKLNVLARIVKEKFINTRSLLELKLLQREMTDRRAWDYKKDTDRINERIKFLQFVYSALRFL
jgi:hypothetical protein